MSRQIVVIAHNIRSTHNVGSLLRTCEGLGVTHLYFTGYTPYPALPNDPRMPHEAAKLSRQIHKTALGTEHSQSWSAGLSLDTVLTRLHNEGYELCALEQSPKSVTLPDYQPPQKVALLLGNEVTGVSDEELSRARVILEIPMLGSKESFNVVQAAAMTLYHLVFWGRS